MILCYFHYVSVQCQCVLVMFFCYLILYCVREAELKPMCEFACVCRFSR